jgi:hypothetical protein
MLDPDWLLESARLKPRPGRPNQTMLKRAISNLYYALFHEFCRQVANLHVGSTPATRRSERYVLIYRSLDHGRMKSHLSAILRNKGAAAPIPTLAQSFIDLQDARHKADYDPRAIFSNAELRLLVQRVEWALTTLREAFPEKELLLTKLIARDRP